MSTAVFPSALMVNLAFPIKRSTLFEGEKMDSISGKETAVSYSSIPRYIWDYPIQVLRQGATPPGGAATPWTEEAVLRGFVEQRFGGFDSWLFPDQDDSSVTGQNIGTGNGSNLNFQLQRTRGGATMPILAPNAVSAVYVNAVLQGPTIYTVNGWGTATPGVIAFAPGHAPGGGLAVTADFTYYFPVRFVMNQQEFQRFMTGLYEVKSLQFRSIK
ncbi:MAG TPA: DUF2460 domain-containing protein [Acetobacteraceae bacterium]|nr:DUF2460 domain-containing protein [Acetobacteraceae bacterium]